MLEVSYRSGMHKILEEKAAKELINLHMGLVKPLGGQRMMELYDYLGMCPTTVLPFFTAMTEGSWGFANSLSQFSSSPLQAAFQML